MVTGGVTGLSPLSPLGTFAALLPPVGTSGTSIGFLAFALDLAGFESSFGVCFFLLQSSLLPTS